MVVRPALRQLRTAAAWVVYAHLCHYCFGALYRNSYAVAVLTSHELRTALRFAAGVHMYMYMCALWQCSQESEWEHTNCVCSHTV